MVAYFGDETEQLARLYAHLTARSLFQQNTAVLAQPTSGRLEALVLLERELRGTLLDQVVELGRVQNFMPGLIIARTLFSLRRRVLLSAATAGRNISTSLGTCELRDQLEIEGVQSPSRTLLGRLASTDSISARLSAGHSILSLSTHSDGVDAKLGSSGVLCPIKQPRIERIDQRPPICLVDGWCRRTKVPIAQLDGKTDLVRPDQINCSLLIVNTCFGILHLDGPIAFRWSLFGAICESANFFAAAFHLNLKEVAAEDIQPLVHNIETGQSLGSAFGAAARCSWSDRFTYRFILVGEPSCRVSDHPSTAQARSLAADTPPEFHPELGKLRIKNQSTKRRKHKQFAQHCFRAATFAHAEASKQVDGTKSTLPDTSEIWPHSFADKVAASRLLVYLCSTKLGLYPLYTTRCEGFVQRALPYGSVCCRTCSKVAQGRLFEDTSGVQRLVTRCESCGALYDQVFDHSVAMRYDDKAHELVISDRSRKMSAACIYVPATGTSTSSLVQPVPSCLIGTEEVRISLYSAIRVQGPKMVGLAYFSGSQIGTISIDVLVVHVEPPRLSDPVRSRG